MRVAQLLRSRGPWMHTHQVCSDTDCLSHRSDGPISLFSSLWKLAIRRPLCLSFSIVPPIHALRGFPYLGSFSVVRCVRHLEGSPWLGCQSVDQNIRHLKGHPGWGPTITCFTLSLKCFSSDADSCPDVGIRPLLHFPLRQRAAPVLVTLLFFP